MEVIYVRQEIMDPVTGTYGVKIKQEIASAVSIGSTDTAIFTFDNNTTSITTNKVYLSNSDTSDHTVQFGIKDAVSGTVNYIISVTVPASTTDQEFTILEGIDCGGDIYMKADADGFITGSFIAVKRYITE